MGLYPVAVCYNARQKNTVPYRTIQYNNTHHTELNKSHKITYNTQGKVVTRHRLYVVGYWRFGTSCRPHLQGSSSSRRPTVFFFLPTLWDNIHLVTSQKIEDLCLRIVDVSAKFRTGHPNTSVTAWAYYAMMASVHERVLIRGTRAVLYFCSPCL